MSKTPLVPEIMHDLAKQVGFSPGLVSGNLIFVSGQVGRRPGVEPPTTPAEEYRLAWENVGLVLAEAGADFSDLVQVTSYHTDVSDLGTFIKVRSELFNHEVMPTWTALGVAALGAPGLTVEITAIAQK